MKRLLIAVSAIGLLAVAWRAVASQAALTRAGEGFAHSTMFVAMLCIAVLLLAAVAVVAMIRARVASRRADRIGSLLQASLSGDAARHPRPQVQRSRNRAAAAPSAAADPGPVDVAGESRADEPLLLPIVSFARNAAFAFDMIAESDAGEGRDPVAADRLRLEQAAVAIALRPESLGLKAPVFVPVTVAFVKDPRSAGFLSALVRGKPELSRGLCLRVSGEIDQAAVNGLAAFACNAIVVSRLPEGDRLATLPAAGVTHLRIVSTDLLSPYAARRVPVLQALEAARTNGLAVIACDVATLDDANRLLDQGIDLMCGPCFGEARRLRPVDAEKEKRSGRRRLEAGRAR